MIFVIFLSLPDSWKAACRSLSRLRYRFVRYYYYTSQNPRWLLMFLLGRFNAVRALVRLFYQAPDLDRYREADSLFANLEVEQAVVSLQEHGYYLGLKLPPDILQEISHFAYQSKIQARNHPEIDFIYADRERTIKNSGVAFVQGTYPNARIQIPALNKLENDSKLNKIAALYFNCEPVHIRTDLSWCFVAERSLYEKNGDAQILFHYDLDDYHALKFFFFLTDVDCAGGPHVCIQGSHKQKKLIHQFSWLIGRSDSEAIDYYGTENLVSICGRAGFGFAEDPFCFHRGTPPTKRDRLMLQVEFAVNNYGMWV